MQSAGYGVGRNLMSTHVHALFDEAIGRYSKYMRVEEALAFLKRIGSCLAP
jgi:hypothetical protein